FSSRQDYKNNSDKKSAEAVAKAKDSLAAQLQSQFDEKAKSPYKAYKGNSTFGTISFNYPKTWSAYVDETNPSEPINAYFYPDIVPGVQSPAAFALRLELVSTTYSQLTQQFSSRLTTGNLRAIAFVPPKMTKVSNVQPGTRFDGVVNQDSQGGPQTGAMLVITVRDKTMQLSTQSTKFLSDFNNIILPSLTFIP
ncbi:MAG TPA: hypothetical protein VHL10_08395, partial [Nitrososphaera sp.]|nr:hypothetical protein [Nitrososphaera sp.]